MVLLLGETLRIETQGSVPVLGVLRGTGSSLTSYVYDNSPAGESAAPQKAYAAAFVLLVFVLGLNLLVERIGRSNAQSHRLLGGGRGRMSTHDSAQAFPSQSANVPVTSWFDARTCSDRWRICSDEP